MNRADAFEAVAAPPVPDEGPDDPPDQGLEETPDEEPNTAEPSPSTPDPGPEADAGDKKSSGDDGGCAAAPGPPASGALPVWILWGLMISGLLWRRRERICD